MREAGIMDETEFMLPAAACRFSMVFAMDCECGGNVRRSANVPQSGDGSGAMTQDVETSAGTAGSRLARAGCSKDELSSSSEATRAARRLVISGSALARGAERARGFFGLVCLRMISLTRRRESQSL